jgi:hypothetical protein
MPKPEPVPEDGEGAAPAVVEAKKPRAKRPPKPTQAKKPSDEGGGSGGAGKRGGLVPKVPLKTS